MPFFVDNLYKTVLNATIVTNTPPLNIYFYRMKEMIFSGRNFMRVIRLLIGMALTVQGVMAADYLLAFLGILFTAMALFVKNCCGNSCSR